jgi:hypothetical protein
MVAPTGSAFSIVMPRSVRDGVLLVAGGLGVGAGIMYVLDPNGGRRRRALTRDRLTHLLNRAEDALAATTRKAANRARGIIAETRAALFPEDATDEVLGQRVRARLGRYVSHPGSIAVVVHEGCVFLSGPILAHEVEPLCAAIRRVRGVSGLENRLDEHERPDDISGLQGGVPRAGAESTWSPTMRRLAGFIALGLVGAGLVARRASSQ